MDWAVFSLVIFGIIFVVVAFWLLYIAVYGGDYDFHPLTRIACAVVLTLLVASAIGVGAHITQQRNHDFCVQQYGEEGCP